MKLHTAIIKLSPILSTPSSSYKTQNSYNILAILTLKDFPMTAFIL